MRRFVPFFAALVFAAAALPAIDSVAQPKKKDEAAEKKKKAEDWNPRMAPLRVRPNAGPCPYVKILYDAARYVEFDGGREASASVIYSGEIEGVEASCEYRDDDPIKVDIDLLFSVGKGPLAQSPEKTYRYWVAVTERNRNILAKEYFDLPVEFDGSDRQYVRDEIRELTIPRGGQEVSGANFEILIGFDVTAEMAEFNRAGKRFRVNAGQPTGQQ